MTTMPTIKCVLVGDGLVGISSLLVTYMTDTFPTELPNTEPTVMENHSKLATVGDEHYNLQLCEASGSEDYDRLRPIMYPGTDVVLVCFSVVDPVSFENIKERWIPEISHYCPGCPYLLVGLQTDLRGDPSTVETLARMKEKPIPPERAEELARQLNAVAYVECSALTKEGVQQVFDQMVLAALEGHYESKEMNRCELL